MRSGKSEFRLRVARAWKEYAKGYAEDPTKILRGAMFDVDYDEMVIVKDISIASVCEHHLVPFTGVAHVAYLPGRRLAGLLGRLAACGGRGRGSPGGRRPAQDAGPEARETERVVRIEAEREEARRLAVRSQHFAGPLARRLSSSRQ